ncbi:FHA domain-containing protein [Nocardia cyriacigeorgica]|uniref:FHA domain-containing protein n=1 Tax=Nocardia cyriacigeorgica TaxID=135487 RepID=A0A6P1D3F2_9NOCA|nr:FHA domain-containing protein [Nocardia cyriacigeorgica]NEW40625.1 FHA domain-containing protein [Nocardia cyriacigeorgica]NEW45096.1 FHA domain-containing protein [Nocardia cyriacigeorgica]NEW51147.1 FHA domain-containing protein [Nocardia cyriacigeorgica]NEW54268.1 FHA domain-containing protein [Nocardia cyriacigeorgica]
MRGRSSTVGVAPGDGLVARFDDVIVYIGGETASTERILGAVEAVAATEHPGAAIAKRLAAVVFGAGSEPPPFGVLAPTDDGTLVLLRGSVAAMIDGAEGARRLTGSRAFTWVDEIVREPFRTISIGPDAGGSVTEHPRTDLRAGVVPGGGFVLRAGVRRSGRKPAVRTATPATRGAPVATAPAGFAAADAEPDQHPSTSAAPPVKNTPSAAARHRAGPRPEGTQAVSLAWSQAPSALRSDPPEPVALHKPGTQDTVRRRPRLAVGATPNAQTPGVLVAEDGATYPLDRPYVIGRGPSADESVRRATASPIVLQRDRHISRVHAFVSLDRGKVFVRDAGTASGTFLATPDSPQWTRVGQTPTELPPGGRIRISERVLTYNGGGADSASEGVDTTK